MPIAKLVLQQFPEYCSSPSISAARKLIRRGGVGSLPRYMEKPPRCMQCKGRLRAVETLDDSAELHLPAVESLSTVRISLVTRER